MRRIKAILNSRSRKGKKKDALENAVRALESAGAHVVVTEGSGILTETQQAIAEGYEIIVGGGGDGTLNTIAGALVGSDRAFGIMPLGTFNHLARDLGIPFNPNHAAGVIRDGQPTYVDAGWVNGLYFHSHSGVGVYPLLIRTRARLEKRGWGKWKAFFASIFALVPGLPILTVRMKAGSKEIVRKTPFVFIGNNRYEMESLKAWKRENLEAGILTVGIVHDRSRFGFIKLMVAALRGRLKMSEEFDVIGLTELTIESPKKKLDITLDGEVRSVETPLVYKIIPKALKIILPKQ